MLMYREHCGDCGNANEIHEGEFARVVKEGDSGSHSLYIAGSLQLASSEAILKDASASVRFAPDGAFQFFQG